LRGDESKGLRFNENDIWPRLRQDRARLCEMEVTLRLTSQRDAQRH
jgi:hypothetical protein